MFGDPFLRIISLQELPEFFTQWVARQRYDFYAGGQFYEDLPEELTFLGLYNEEGECPFVSDYAGDDNVLVIIKPKKAVPAVMARLGKFFGAVPKALEEQ